MKGRLTILLLGAALASGCAASQPPTPFTYLALERPQGPINGGSHTAVQDSFSRGGFYFLNYNFRPAAEIGDYLTQAEHEANSKVLREADVQLNVPFAIDILLFGYNGGTDTVTATGESSP